MDRWTSAVEQRVVMTGRERIHGWMRSLIPGLLGIAAAWYRFPDSVTPWLLELSHYLPAVERLRHGQLPGRDFIFLFGPALPDLLRAWLAVAGDTVVSTQDFFRFGWALYLVCLGVLVHRSGVTGVIGAAIMVWFAIWALPEPMALHAWGGPRYLTGILLLVLLHGVVASTAQGDTRVVSRRMAVTALFTPLLAAVAVEQVVLTLLAFALLLLIPGAATLRALLMTRVVWHGAIAGLLAGLTGLWLTRRAGLFMQYVVELRYYGIWRQPFRPTDLEPFLLHLLVAVLVFALWWRHRSTASRDLSVASRVASEGALLLLGLFALLQYAYAARAFGNLQGTLAIGLLMVWSLTALHACWAAQQRRGVVLLLGMVVLILGHRRTEHAATRFLLQWQANLTGVPAIEGSPNVLMNRRPKVTSRLPRLAGSQLPLWFRDDVDSVVAIMARETSPSGPPSFVSYPETGVFEYLLGRPAQGRFPIMAMAETRPEWRAELLAQLRTAPPHLVIRQRQLGGFASSIGRTEELFPEIPRILERSYERVAVLNRYEVYRLRGAVR